MKKTDKKIENAIIKALNCACEIALDEVAGFKWLTHSVRYSDFPGSFSVVCVFDTNRELADSLGSKTDDYLRLLVRDQLSAAGIHIKDIGQCVHFDTEEACRDESGGKWHERLR